MKKYRVFTWHVHGSYLYYLVHTNAVFYVPVKEGRPEGYVGKSTGSFPWPDNVHEIPADEVKNHEFDCIIFQSKNNFLTDQYEILNEKQRQLPKIYIEHDPPRDIPTDTKHIVDDPHVLLVHVTHFNNLMWDSNHTPTTVIDHGVIVPHNTEYKGNLEKGIVVINNIVKRGRRLGYDIFEKVRKEVPLDIVGMGVKEIGGIGEISHNKLSEFISHYRFFFNPIRYTSLGLSIIESMMIGQPIVGLATTELPTVITNGENGYIDTNVEHLIYQMKKMIADKEYAKKLGEGAKQTAMERFNIQRFAQDWEKTITSVCQNNNNLVSLASSSFT